MTALTMIALLAAAEPAACRPGAERVARADGPARARPLGEMPDARAVLAVKREVGGCAVLLVRERGGIVEEPVGRPEARRAFRP